jgi:hypothetical protein
MSSIKKKPQRELFEGVGGFKIWEQIIRTVQYVSHHVAVNEEERELQGISEKLIET